MTEFEADESYHYVEFSGIRGESHIFLNGAEIGYVPPADAFTCKRAYRFDCTFVSGINRLTVKQSAPKNVVVVLEDAVIGRTVQPKVQHPLFGGRLLLILHRRGEGHLIAETEAGHRAEIPIPEH